MFSLAGFVHKNVMQQKCNVLEDNTTKLQSTLTATEESWCSIDQTNGRAF